MSKIVAFREEIFSAINELLKQRSFIFLWGKTGSGKSVLLKRLAKVQNAGFISEIFENEDALKESILKLKSQGVRVIIIDELGTYSKNLLENLRIYSDELSFVLSSHKKIKLFKKDYFKSRLSACFELKKPSLRELDEYIRAKFGLEFALKNIKFLEKICKGNLRYIDKILKSFCELKPYFSVNKTDYILRLSALENELLR